MNEEKYINAEEQQDELTMRITVRLGERKRMLDRMAEMEQSGRRSYKLWAPAASFAVAAGIAALVVFNPFAQTMSPLEELNIQQPTMMEFRSASPSMSEITELMEAEDYAAALEKSEIALRESDRGIKAFSGMENLDEEMAYDMEMGRVENQELRWTYIYLLVHEKKEKEAVKQLKIYLKDKQHSGHREEAEALLRKILKK